MTDAPGLEFRRVGPGLEGGLAAFFAALDGAGDGRWFHPHPLTAAEAARLCAYHIRDGSTQCTACRCSARSRSAAARSCS
jgi:hypothetical protein